MNRLANSLASMSPALEDATERARARLPGGGMPATPPPAAPNIDALIEQYGG